MFARARLSSRTVKSDLVLLAGRGGQLGEVDAGGGQRRAPGSCRSAAQLPQSTLPVVGSIALQAKSLLIGTLVALLTRRPPSAAVVAHAVDRDVDAVVAVSKAPMLSVTGLPRLTLVFVAKPATPCCRSWSAARRSSPPPCSCSR